MYICTESPGSDQRHVIREERFKDSSYVKFGDPCMRVQDRNRLVLSYDLEDESSAKVVRLVFFQTVKLAYVFDT
jgi:hypothetical protein